MNIPAEFQNIFGME